MALCFYAVGVLAWEPSALGMTAAPVAAWMLFVGILFHFGHTLRALMEAQREFNSRELRSASERMMIERELELARKIQDSLAPPTEMICGRSRARCFQRKHSQVGGDWAALRQVGDDLYMVVADAAGKGLQAALVIHAVQSLWAETLQDEMFEPAAWMAKVNVVLSKLGEKQVHMVTMGILRLGPDGGTYWSAGHLPVYVVTNTEVRQFLGRGSPLGIKGMFACDGVEVPVGATPCSILLGSDGVFHRGTLHPREDLVGLITGLAVTGAAHLDQRPAEDDKTLVWVEYGRSAQEAPAVRGF